MKFGLVGYGFGGRVFHAPLITSAPACDLVAVLTNSPQRRALVRAELPGARPVASLEELVAAGAEAVAISTPADTHSAVSEQALRLGLAVVCDKPFALDAASARRTIELAEDLRLPLAPYQNRRWDSDFLTVRKLVADGTLGVVTRLESRFERYAPADGPAPAGGGTLLDFGSHLVDQALTLLGPAASVYAEASTRDSGLDDDVFVAITHAGGARSHLWGGWMQFAPGPRFRVSGTDATYVLDAADTQEQRLVAGQTPASHAADWGMELPDTFGIVRTGTAERMCPTERGSWDHFYPSFAAAVRQGESVPVRPRDALATALVLDAARESVVSGAGVRPVRP